MTDFENWCRETGYNPHTFEALEEYSRYLYPDGSERPKPKPPAPSERIEGAT